MEMHSHLQIKQVLSKISADAAAAEKKQQLLAKNRAAAAALLAQIPQVSYVTAVKKDENER